MNRTTALLLTGLALTTLSAMAAEPPDITEGAAPVVAPGNTVVRIGNPDTAAPGSPAPAAPAVLRDLGSGCNGSWQVSGGTPARLEGGSRRPPRRRVGRGDRRALRGRPLARHLRHLPGHRQGPLNPAGRMRVG